MLMTTKPDIDPGMLNYAMLSRNDLANIVLQRSEILVDVPRPGEVIREWMEGDARRLEEEVERKGAVLAQRAMRVIQVEFEALAPVLDGLRPRKIADIGCGYGFFDLLAHARYGADLLLIDIEQNERRHFGFDEEAAAYTSLQTARAFLTGNGVPAAAIETWNPETDEISETDKPDLAVSFLSCGFHFPVDMYMPFFRFGVAPGGSIILDLRKGAFRESKRQLAKLGAVEVIGEGRARRRVLVRKGRR